MLARGSEAPRWFLALACWAGLFVLYLSLAGGPTWPEIVVGGLSSLLATVAMLVSGDREHLGRMRWGWWWLLARRLPGQILTDTSRVVRVALEPSPPSGGFVRVPFDPGGDDPASGSRRALVTAGGSVSPNAFVARIDREQGTVLIHQLVRTNAPPGHGDTQWPI